MSNATPPKPPLDATLLAECAAYLRARLDVERYVFVDRATLTGVDSAGGRTPPPAFVRALPTGASDSGSAPPAIAPSNDAPAADRLERFHADIRHCLECSLGHTRTKFVFGAGNPDADLMLIGEAPGREEDLQGVPFVGAAGELLTKILAAINLRREDVYIANVLKCRPPGNRDPEPHEVESCRPYVEEQIRIIQPRLIVALGRFAAQLLTGRAASLSQLRSENHSWHGIPVIPTYHPSALLRYPTYKRPTWEDMKRVRAELDRLAAIPRPGAGAGSPPRTGASHGSGNENAARAERS